jgi:CDP-diacylglycerol--serine O-phosphatidyltransferase
MLRLKKAKMKPMSSIRLIPNLITLSALVVGMNSIRFALDGRWEFSVTCIILAAFLDAADGRVARMIGATSTFGAELDSLTDFANFGVAPAIISYLWAFERSEFKLFSWAAILLFVICMVIRLARFNVALSGNKNDPRMQNFFVGVPAPLGALLFLLPIIFDFELCMSTGFELRSHLMLVGIYQIIIAALVSSRLYTYSFKNIEVKPEHVWIYMVAFAAAIITLVLYSWSILPVVGILYLCLIPLSHNAARKVNYENKK